MDPQSITPCDASLYGFDEEAHTVLLHTLQQHHQRLRVAPQDVKAESPVVFTDVWVSDLALTKMMLHAEKGGRIEVMGLLLGKAVTVEPTDPAPHFSDSVSFVAPPKDGDVREQSCDPACMHAEGDGGAEAGRQIERRRGYFVVTDCFALPVEGTETRVNAAEDANEYMIQYLEEAEKIPTPQKVVGWYHSHPNYGCWLSGIDVRTQQLQQQHQDPFLAIVLGAFRTFLPGEERRHIDEMDKAEPLLPEDKVHDFGVHWQHYYPLKVHYCCNSLSAKLIEGMKKISWPHILTTRSLQAAQDRATQISRVSSLLDSAKEAIAASDAMSRMYAKDLARTRQVCVGGNRSPTPQESGDSVDISSVISLPDELNPQTKPPTATLRNTAEEAAGVALQAMEALVETAALSAAYPDRMSWAERLMAENKKENIPLPLSQSDHPNKHFLHEDRAVKVEPDVNGAIEYYVEGDARVEL
ncbi:COP9 signalosome complex subunit 5 [Cyclospora cayetanensis]|uniref:COP9 signalosome complex subunit 5 n=1 Tax=Cyclospora cayetanensis TaxID=88456 RepID=A0A6P6RQU3_9EIME|nr:COP9 signalosome complex subunit 5 [Cyclospora cayetanensis]